jgi:antitoxin HicB
VHAYLTAIERNPRAVIEALAGLMATRPISASMKRDDLKLDQYRFTVRPMTAEEGTGYPIEFPDVPLCLSDGATVEEAIVNGRDALKCCLLAMKKFGDPIPKPGSAEASSGQFRLRVPKTIHARLMQRADREGVSLNTLGATLIAEGLGKRRAG